MKYSQEGNSSSISCCLYDTYNAEEIKDPQIARYKKNRIGIQTNHSTLYQKRFNEKECITAGVL